MASRTVRSVLALAAAMAAIAGCAATHPAGGGPPTDVSSRGSAAAGITTTSPPRDNRGTRYGLPAQQLAARVPGCAPHAVTAQTAATELRLPPGHPLFTRALSAATCTLQGRTALLLTYPDAHGESAAAASADAIIAYFAAGPGWLAVPIDRSEPVGQQSVVQDVALALHGHVGIGARAPRVSAAGR